jgi:hypothetical protein
MVGIGVDLGATMVGLKMRVNYAQRFYVSSHINFYVMVLPKFAGRERSPLPRTPIASSNPERSDGWVPTINGFNLI